MVTVSEQTMSVRAAFWSWQSSDWKGLLPSVWLVAATAALCMFVSELNGEAMTPPTLAMVFVVPVVLSAVLFGFWPALLTTALGALAWDYLFDKPYFRLSITDPHDVIAAIAFLVVSLLVILMIAPVKRQREQLASLADSLSVRYAMSQKLSRLATVEAIATFLSTRAGDLVGCEVTVVAFGRNASLCDVFPRGRELSLEDLGSANAVLKGNLPIGTPDSAYLALDGNHGCVGVLCLHGPNVQAALLRESEGLSAFALEAAIAIERATLAGKIEGAKMPTGEPSQTSV